MRALFRPAVGQGDDVVDVPVRIFCQASIFFCALVEYDSLGSGCVKAGGMRGVGVVQGKLGGV